MRRIYPFGLLVVERSAERAEALINLLRRSGLSLSPRWVSAPGELAELLREQAWDLLLVALDSELPSPARIMEAVQASGRDLAVIGIARGPGALEPSDDALRAGFHDVVAETAVRRLEHAVTRELQSLSQRRNAQALRSELRESSRTLQEIMRASTQAVALVHGGRILRANPAWLGLFGVYSGNDPHGLPLDDFVIEEERDGLSKLLNEQTRESIPPVEVDLIGITADGEEFPIHLEITKATFEGRRCVLVIARAAAETSSGTRPGRGTRPPYDRRLLIEAINAAPRVAGSAEPAAALICLWIENYEKFAQTLGLSGVVQLMDELRDRLTAQLHEDAVLATVSDDTFGIFLPGTSTQAAQETARLLADCISRDVVEVGGRTVRSACSTGMAFLSAAQWNATAAVDAAYAESHRPEMMNRAIDPQLQLSGTGAGETQDQRTIEEIAEDLHEAMSDGRLTLVFQPIVRLHGEPMELYEVFLRLKNRQGAPVPTRTVFSAAKRAGLEVELDLWVIRHAIGLLERRHHQSHDTHLFVKLSDQCMNDIRVALTVGRELNGREYLGSKLIVELSEAAASNNLKAARAFVQSLTKFGCPAALDYFGLSLSAFQLLEDVPATFLKLDATLVNRLADDPKAFAQVAEICERAAGLGKHTIASYLDNPQSLPKLYEAGVEFAQGYYIQEPGEHLDYEFSIIVE